MRRSRRPPDRGRGAPDEGSAAIEVLVLGVLLLVPLVYLVLTLSAVQAASFAVSGAARQAARAITESDTAADAAPRAAAAVGAALADWRIPPGAVTTTVSCAPDPDDCLTPRGTVAVAVQASVALPLLPPVVAAGQPGSLRVGATALQRVSMFAARATP